MVDPNGNVTEYEYDPNNDRLLSVSNPSTAAETEFAYNASGQTTRISNSDVAYNLSYDTFGRPTGVNILGTTLSTNSYNTENQLSSTVFGNGDSVEYAYNEDKLLSSVKYDGVLSYEYFYTSQNQVGRLVDHDNDVTWEYFYDMAGRLTDVESDSGKKIEYGYDSKGNPGSLTVKDGTSTLTDIGYSYDSQNRPSAVTVNSMTGQPSQTYTYDSLGRITGYVNTTNSATPQNKITRSFSYLTNGSLQTNRIGSVSYTSGSSELIPDYNYIYDSNGNITTVYSTEFEINYLYDELNRLVRENNTLLNKTTIYTYDKNGDILKKTEYPYTMSSNLGTVTATINYQYGDADCPNGLTNYNGETVTYDANGNPLTYRGYTMTWEKGRQLASMTKNGTTLSFKYDSSGMRTEKTTGSNKVEYTYVGEKLVSMKSGSTILNFSYGADGSPYGFTYNGTSYFYLLNLQGDVIGIHDASGNVVARYSYDAWGKQSSPQTTNSAVALSNPLRYRGYVYDTETNLYYLQSRYYDPDTGRFINADSLLIAGKDCIQGTNMFTYCYNNPVMYSDPSGYVTTEEAIYISVGIVAGLMYLGEKLPVDSILVFLNSVKDLPSGVIVADAILGLCEILGDSIDYSPQEGGGYGYKYEFFYKHNIYKLMIPDNEIYIYVNNFNVDKISEFTNLAAEYSAKMTKALITVGSGSFLIGFGIGGIAGGGSTLIKLAAGAVASGIPVFIAGIAEAFGISEHTKMENLFYQIINL